MKEAPTKEGPMADDATSQAQQKQDVERIREIIFGAQMRDYQQQFQALQRDVDRLRQQIEELGTQLGDADREQGKKVQDLRREMRQADDGLRDELRQTSAQLLSDKVDRAVLGELFIQLGTQLKTGGSLSDQLKDLAL